jgi:hypothetical protein
MGESAPVTPRWANTARALVAMTSLCALGMMGCGFLSSGGNIWERFTIAAAFGFIGSMAATFGLVVVYYLKIRFNLSRLVRCRSPLTDKDFRSSSPELAGADLVVVHRVRQALANQFRSMGGDRFRCDDDLETDLHLRDLCFWGEWLETLTADLGIEEHEFARELESVPIKTLCDLVLLFDRLWRLSKATKCRNDHVQSHPIWDRTVDG